MAKGITFKHAGGFQNLENFLARMLKNDLFSALEAYGQQGVAALRSVTPRDSGETAESWDYVIRSENGQWSVEWINTHMAGSAPVAILLQYGHATGTGGYVRGYDYINPAIQPIFDDIADSVWKKVIAK
jgi:hypothetical protein